MQTKVAPSRLDADFAVDPDYTTHPAYGALFGRPGLGLRFRALGRLLAWMGFLALKRCFLGDRLQPESGRVLVARRGLAARLRVAPRYLPIFGKQFLRQFSRPRVGTVEHSPLFEALLEDGIATAALSAKDLQWLRTETAPAVEELAARRANKRARTFQGSQRWLERACYRDLYSGLERILEQSGALDAASHYLGRQAQVVCLLVQVNDPGDHFFYGDLSDVGLQDSSTQELHMDSTYGVLKCMVYLSDVAEKNGPFSYVLGSHRLKMNGWTGLVRRAVERSGLGGLDRPSREAFMALPAAFRKKARCGNDWMDGTQGSRKLLAAEYRWTSADGNLALFDNLGLHRGGLVREGERRALFAILG